MLAAPAAACSPPPYYPPPALPGESDDSYRARIETQTRRNAEAVRLQQEAAQLAREETLWHTADRIVVAEVIGLSGWREDRRGASYRTVTMRLITAARGRVGATRLQLRSYDGGDACFGPQGSVYPEAGKLVLFARSGKLSDTSVIDWSNATRSTHPETLALLENTRGPRG